MENTSPRTHTPVERHQLANGLRVVFSRDDSLPLVTVNLWYHVGSKNERPGRTGFAHLFEHMLFQGSEHVGTHEHFRYIQQVGGVANGSTSRDRTNYYETLPAHHLSLALWLESDRMGFLLPAITEEKLETQRQVVMNERLQRVDNQPYGRAMERLYELLFPGDHPYHWPVIGYMDDIAQAPLEEVKTFFETWYRPNNAVLTLVGGFDPEQALAQIETYFGDLPAGPTPPPVRPEPPRPQSLVREVMEDDIRLPRVYVAAWAPGFGEDGWHAADLLSTALGDGQASRLYQDLVYHRELAQSVSAYINDNEVASPLVVMATARPGVEAPVLEEALCHHLDALVAEPVSEGDLERARNRLLTQHFDRLQRLDRRADLLAQLTTYADDPARIDRETEPYLRLGPDELHAFARQQLVEHKRVVLSIVPREPAR